MEIHHIGYLVKDINKAYEKLELLGYKFETSIHFDSIQNANITFLINGTYRIELIQPINPESIVYNLLKKIGSSPYHIGYTCNQLESSVMELKQKGFTQISEILDSVTLHKQFCFMYNDSIGIIELIEN